MADVQTTFFNPTEHRGMEFTRSAVADPIDAGASTTFDVSVIVVNYNTAHLLQEMRAALMASRGNLALQVIVIDNASRDDSLAVLKRDFVEVELITNQANVGFGRANNQGVALAKGRYILLLNTDAFVAPDTLCETVHYMDAHPDVGILGARLVGRDGVLQPSCRYFPTPWNVFLARSGLGRLQPRARMVDDMTWDHASVRECDWVPGCYYLVRRELVEQVGLFDPRYFLYCEEVDNCRVAKHAGWKVVCFALTSVVHLGGESSKSEGTLTAGGKQISALQIESELLYFRKHHGVSGALASLLLGSLADALIVTKCLLRRRGRASMRPVLEHFRNCWRLALRTRLGADPTR